MCSTVLNNRSHRISIMCCIACGRSLMSQEEMCGVCNLAFLKGVKSQIETVKGGVQYATVASSLKGLSAEKKFENTCISRGLEYRPATEFENKKLHFDFVVKHRDSYFRVDVKSMKSKRMGGQPDPNIIFVEFRNVSGGPGWIYGSADYIAFDMISHFMMVRRDDLLKLSEKMAKNTPKVNQSGVLHTRYSRIDRDDEIFVLSVKDVYRNMKVEILKARDS